MHSMVDDHTRPAYSEAFEIPLVAKAFAETGQFDAVIGIARVTGA
jgi:6,7-dimethyl-8-ribityllumazine synthase